MNWREWTSSLYDLHNWAGRMNPYNTVACMISATGLWLCLVGAYVAAMHWSLGWAIVWFACGSSLDAIDGLVARRMNQASNWGAYFDALCDKQGEAAILVGLAFRVGDPWAIRWLMLAAVLGLMASYSKAVAVEKKTVTNWPEVRIFGRGLRVTAILAMMIMLIWRNESVAAYRLTGEVLTFVSAIMLAWRNRRVKTAGLIDRINEDAVRELTTVNS
jgi:phosphatidylglycerophosphate synthase